jgi:hypothetical protein
VIFRSVCAEPLKACISVVQPQHKPPGCSGPKCPNPDKISAKILCKTRSVSGGRNQGYEHPPPAASGWIHPNDSFLRALDPHMFIWHDTVLLAARLSARIDAPGVSQPVSMDGSGSHTAGTDPPRDSRASCSGKIVLRAIASDSKARRQINNADRLKSQRRCAPARAAERNQP